MPANNGKAGGSRLVIVESPAKARTIAGYLGSDYVVESSIGHIRDLPEHRRRHPRPKSRTSRGAGSPSTSTTASTPTTSCTQTRRPHRQAQELLKDADELYLATDEDREGEAIAWHLLDELKPKVPVHRMVFHEITRPAILDAVANPRQMNATSSRPRRPAASSTGSTATRSARCCGRRSCPACRPAACSRWRPGWSSTGSGSGWRSGSRRYWDLEGTFDAGTRQGARGCSRPSSSGRRPRVAGGSDFGNDGELKGSADDCLHLDARGRRGPGRRACTTRRTTCGRWSPSPTAARPTRRSARRRCSRRPAASWASRRSHDVGRPAAVRERLHHLHADRRTTLSEHRGRRRAVSQVRELYGAEYLPDAPRDLRREGQERPGGARGDPPVRRAVPHARPRPG